MAGYVFMGMSLSRKAYRQFLNEIGVPFGDRKENGGRIPRNAMYGNWLWKHDPISFQVGYSEWVNEEEYRLVKEGEEN